LLLLTSEVLRKGGTYSLVKGS
jgi:hypothetical protein